MNLKVLTILFFIVTVYGCNTSTDSNAADPDESAETTVHTDIPKAALSLNKGEKWLSDESTDRHVSNLSEMLAAFSKVSHTDISDYRKLGADIQKELDGLIRDCRMKGPDHEALHLWLEPVLKQTAELKKEPAADKAEELVKDLTVNVNKFKQYFKDAD